MPCTDCGCGAPVLLRKGRSAVLDQDGLRGEILRLAPARPASWARIAAYTRSRTPSLEMMLNMGLGGWVTESEPDRYFNRWRSGSAVRRCLGRC